MSEARRVPQRYLAFFAGAAAGWPYGDVVSLLSLQAQAPGISSVQATAPGLASVQSGSPSLADVEAA